MMNVILAGLTCHQPCRDIYFAVEVPFCSPSGSHRLHHSSESPGYVLLWEALLCRLQVSS